ncbi:MAG: beta-galactosidase [Kiritimatiellaeota bacterium]|nr:beta-galactosidase [Kiritimatiellota bacterium]
MKIEKVICGVPFGSPCEKEALAAVKELGFTSVQIYTFWRDFEPGSEGGFDWKNIDREVALIKEAGLKYVPFLLMGPKYAAPDWWLKDPRHRNLKCLEHNRESLIESIWNPAFNAQIERVCQAFAAHFMPMDVLESVQPGICGDYGEALYPAVGNWPGDYHTHRGLWVAGDDAKADMRAHLRQLYGDEIAALNKAWRTSYASFDAIEPFPKHRAPSRTAWLDFILWTQDSMTRYSEFWMKTCRAAFPGIPIYLCTGGADDEMTAGANFAAQSKIAARHGGGIRLTNEVNIFSENFRLTAHTHAACEFYGAYLGLEPVGPITTLGARTRIFGSAAYGNRQIFHYYGNFFEHGGVKRLPSAAECVANSAFLAEHKPERGLALFWPVDQALFDEAMPAAARDALMFIRRFYPVTPVSETMIMDGARDGFSTLLMIGAKCTRRAVLEKITGWVNEREGRLLATERCLDWEMEPVVEFDALFGITPESEDAWGHCGPKVHAPAGYPSLAEMKSLHAEHAWLNLMPDTDKWIVEDMHPGQSGTTIHPVAALFRRAHGKGEAIFFSGAVNFKYDKEACFDDGGFFPKFLADLCAQTGVAPWGIRPDEIARCRIDGKTLALTEEKIHERNT